MKIQTQLLTSLLVLFSLVSFLGCSKKEDETPAETSTASELNTQTPVESTEQSDVDTLTVKGMLELWDAGQKDEAVKQFLSVKWDDPSAYQDMPVLISMSDKQWYSLPRDEQLSTTQEAIQQTGRLRQVMFEVVSVGKTFAESGDTQIAKKHFESVVQLGKALSQPQRFEVVRGYGEAALKYAQKNLSAL